MRIIVDTFSETPLARKSQITCMPLALTCCVGDVSFEHQLEELVTEGNMIAEEDGLLTSAVDEGPTDLTGPNWNNGYGDCLLSDVLQRCLPKHEVLCTRALLQNFLIHWGFQIGRSPSWVHWLLHCLISPPIRNLDPEK